MEYTESNSGDGKPRKPNYREGRYKDIKTAPYRPGDKTTTEEKNNSLTVQLIVLVEKQ